MTRTASVPTFPDPPHAQALADAPAGAALAGGAIVLMYKWDPGAALKLIEKYRITSLSGVPTMSREIIDHLGGRLWAERHPGQGATFSFTLPIASLDEPAIDGGSR